MKKLLKTLCNTYSVSGNEEKIAKVCSDLLSDFCKIKVDKNKNVFAYTGNLKSDYTLLIDAHIDQIGFIVTQINDDGFIKAQPCGGIDLRILQGSQFLILGRSTLFAVVISTPPHLIKNDSQVLKEDEIWFDTGQDVKKVKEEVSIGDNIVFYASPKELVNNKVTSLGMDNRCGVAILIKVLEMLKDEKLNLKVVGALSVQEETTMAGGKTSSFEISPDEAIALDVSFATQNGVSEEHCGQMDKGVMIGMSPVLDKEMTKSFIEIAKNNDIKYQLEIMNTRTGTNADNIAVTKRGVKTGLLSIPLKNMHTPCEIVSINDMESTANLLYNYIIKRSVDLS